MGLASMPEKVSPPPARGASKEKVGAGERRARPPPEEWEPLSRREREVATALRRHFGEERFASIPGDLLVPFIRGYQLEDAWVDTSTELLSKTLEWRASVGADTAVVQPPPGQLEFEKLYQAGPVRRDAEGRAVVLERVGRTRKR